MAACSVEEFMDSDSPAFGGRRVNGVVVRDMTPGYVLRGIY